MIILKIIFVIVLIAVVVGVCATFIEVISKRKNTHKPYSFYEKYIKRGLDAFLATGAIIVLSPILLVITILVRIKLGSPVLFKQDRPGLDERIFRLCKFRSMTDEKDENGELLPDEIRLTKFGRALRSTSLDELPELLNIIRGDMALIGPRPLLVSYLPYYTEQERHRHDVRPGLTGLAQVNGRNSSSWEQTLSYDVAYVKKITFWGDVRIIRQTLFMINDAGGWKEVAIGCARFQEPKSNGTPNMTFWPRSADDETMLLFDIVSIDQEKKEVRFTRVGAGEDRVVLYTAAD